MENTVFAASKLLKERNYNKVLDIGSGTGRFLRKMLEELDYNITIASDITDRFIMLQRENIDNQRLIFVKADAAKLPFLNGEFDLVTVSNALHHFESIDEVVHEMKRVVKPGGLLLVEEMINNDLTVAQQNKVDLNHLYVEVDQLRGFVHNYTLSLEEVKGRFNVDGLLHREEFIIEEVNNRRMDETYKQDIFQGIDRLLKRIEDNEHYHRLKMESERLKKSINIHGLSSDKKIALIYEKN